MKRIILSFVSFFLLFGCSGIQGDNRPVMGDGFLKAFNLDYMNRGKYHGTVADGRVTLGGIEYGRYVTGVEVQLCEGAVIAPAPEEFVGNWPQSQEFTVTTSDGTVRKYTVELTSFVADTPDNGDGNQKLPTAVIAYLVADDFQFDQLFGTLDWSVLTHVLPSFCQVRSDGSIDSKKMDKNISSIRDVAHANRVKVLASFNAAGKGQFEAAIQTPESRERLAVNMVDYVKSNALDGVDIDYEEYSNLNKNISNLLDLFQRIRSKLGEGYQMTSAMNPGNWLQYGIHWHESFDYINLMIYDRLNTMDTRPVQHAPFDDYVQSIEYAVTEYQIPAFKIAAGLPFYGYTWENGTASSIRFNTIVSRYPGDQQVVENDNVGKIYYNGKETIRRKTRHVLDNNLGGVMIWQLFQDAYAPEDRLLDAVKEVLLPEEKEKI